MTLERINEIRELISDRPTREAIPAHAFYAMHEALNALEGRIAPDNERMLNSLFNIEASLERIASVLDHPLRIYNPVDPIF